MQITNWTKPTTRVHRLHKVHSATVAATHNQGEAGLRIVMKRYAKEGEQESTIAMTRAEAYDLANRLIHFADWIGASDETQGH